MSGQEDFEQGRRNYQAPHSGRHPIPTIQQYQDLKQHQRAELHANDVAPEQQHSSQFQSAIQAGKDYWYGAEGKEPTPAAQPPPNESAGKHPDDRKIEVDKQADGGAQPQGDGQIQDTTEHAQVDQKTKRKQMTHRKPDEIERQVTDPVTHLPVTIHDFSSKDVKRFIADDDEANDIDRQEDPAGPQSPARTLREQGRAESSLDHAKRYQQSGLHSMLDRFPPPDFDAARQELGAVYHKTAVIAMIALLVGAGTFVTGAVLVPETVTLRNRTFSSNSITGSLAVGVLTLVGSVMWSVQLWSQRQVQSIWDDAVWSAQHTKAKEDISTGERESTLWFSKIIGSIWPLVNPDLFTSVSDTLEDVMQASLPKFVRMVSVEDIGQGSEPLRILGINWLPKGAASQSVGGDGKPSAPSSPTDSRRNSNDQSQSADKQGQDGMEGDEGDFLNLEIAFAYRASRFQKKGNQRSKNAHLYLAFYLPGNIKLPVFVELKGVVGICRARLQLTPDPPFVALCTLTFMGQPKVDMNCVPLLKRGLDIMDLPLISNFVQGSIDAALSEYVAPKSISLDLQAMLVGDDFKRDTEMRGVLAIRIFRCFDFKAGDPGIPIIRPGGSSDSYISVGWAKFGKPLWSTRVIADDMEPYWDEEAFIPVGPQELDAGESLRVQLWDSDKLSADDDQGRIEIPLKELMTDERSNGKVWHRVDPFRALQADKEMPGRCEWSVGYFSKTRLLEEQMKQQMKDKEIKSIDDLKRDVYRKAERKLREAAKNEQGEIEVQQRQDWEATETQMISDSLPSEDYPSGILSVHVHQIIGLNLQQMSSTGRDIPEGENDDADTDHSQLPDSYCTMILNHQKIFKTRTKPKNAAPFFNAATERYVRDWRSTDLTLSVRDARVHEDDPLIGFVHFNLGEHFRKRRTSHTNDFYPLSGGIGYGRVRISLCFRSVQLQSPEPALGWELGTVEIGKDISATDDLPKHLRRVHLKLRTNLESGRMQHKRGDNQQDDADDADDTVARWTPLGRHPVLLAVQRRYASNLMIEFRNPAGLLKEKVPAAAVLWLNQLTDEEEQTLELPVWRTDKKMLARLRKNTLPEDKCGERLGSLRITVRFWRGIGKGHEKKLGKRNVDVQNVIEVLDAARDQRLVGPLVGDRHWKRSRLAHMESKDASDDEDDDGGNNNDDDSDDDDDDDDDNGPGNEGKTKKKEAPSTPARAKSVPVSLGPIDAAITHPAAGSTPSKGLIDPAKTHPASFFTPRASPAEATPRSSMADTPPSRTQSTRSSKRGSGIFSSAADYLENKAQLHRQHRGVMQWKGPRTLAWMKHKADKAVDRVSGSFEHSGREPDIETEV